MVEAPNHKTGRSTVDMLERFAGEGNDVLYIATDDVALGGGGEDEINVHISQFVSGKPFPLIADLELTEDKIVITYDPAVMSNTTITYTSVENGLLVNVGGVSVLKLEGAIPRHKFRHVSVLLKKTLH